MIRKVLLSFLSAFPLFGLAQDRCTAHTITERWLRRQGLSTDLLQYAHPVDHNALRGGGPLAVPVVVHVVWNIAAENVSDVVIQNMIDIMNEDFAALNSDYDNARAVFLNDRGVPNIEFCLAIMDPNGQPTTGITRTQTSETWFDPENETDDMKSAPKGIAPWDPFHYLNIWICDISSGSASDPVTTGYSYMPIANIVGSNVDGIVIDHDLGLQAGSRTATHEAGHYLGLDHPWAGGGCGSDDQMADTPVTDGPTYSCTNTSLIKCGNLVQYENFMDYSNCRCMFTNDQCDEMADLLNTDRFELLQSDACTGAASVNEIAANAFTCAVENGMLSLHWPENLQAERFSLFDATGRLVLSDRVTTTGALSHPIAGLASGAYTVILDFKDGPGTNRVLIP